MAADLQETVNFLMGENYLLTGGPLMGAVALGACALSLPEIFLTHVFFAIL